MPLLNRIKDANAVVAALLFCTTLGIYASTISSTISFWDCGEFVSTAYGLGIPHQPGTPLYVLVGRIFSLIPLGIPIALKINLMSGFFAALAVSFTYLTAVRLQQNWSEEKADPSPPWLIRSAAAVGATFLALSTTFWNNATEAEVYSLAAFVLAATGYMIVRWYEVREKESSSGMLLILIYVMGLSVGFHLGSVLVYPGVFVLALLCRNKALQNVDLWIVSMAMGTFVLSTMVKWDMVIAILYVVCIAVAVARMVTPGGSGFAMAGITLFLLGLSVHLFMLIRTTQEPFINQSVPDTFDRLMMVIRREQYPPRVPWEREAPLAWQFGHLFGSSFWQGSSLVGKQTIGYLQQFTFLPKPNFLDVFVPTLLWLYGLFNLFRGNAKLAWSFFTILLINSVGLLIMLNFTATEVRDRDYFYFGAFQFCALFMGLGAGGLLRAVWRGFSQSSQGRYLTMAGAALLLVVAALPALLPGHVKWYEHDRTGDQIARNYGYNMLSELPENAILFTNGDNDTFPLWYLQEVEGFRTDVRVVNLSLINVPWYIKQLRDVEPTVPMSWNDPQVEGRQNIDHRGSPTPLLPQRLPDNSVLWVRDMAVWHIIEQNRFQRAIYFAVTIPPEYMQDYMPYCSMEGLVYRLTRTRNEGSNEPKVDSMAILNNLTQRYDMSGVVEAMPEGEMNLPQYAGLSKPPLWKRDTSRYKDHNTTHLLKNYPAALSRVGFNELVAQNTDLGLEALELAYQMDPYFPYVVSFLPLAYLQAGKTARAMEVAYDYLETVADPSNLVVDFGENLLAVGEFERGIAWASRAYEIDPDEPAFVRMKIRALWQGGEGEQAVQLLSEYVARTGDRNAAGELQELRDALEKQSAQADSLEEGGERP